MIALLMLPHWLTSEQNVAFATWGLVVATLLLALITLGLVLDSRANRREQRERWAKEDVERWREHSELLEKWNRDDEARVQQAKPHYRWGFNHDIANKKLGIWVANLGSTSFLLTAIWVERQGPLDRQAIDARPVPFVLTEVVDKGTRMNFDVLRGFPFPSSLPMRPGGFTTVRYEVWCTIESTESQQTPRKAIEVTLNRQNQVISTSEDAVQKLNPSLAVIL